MKSSAIGHDRTEFEKEFALKARIFRGKIHAEEI